jgi:hypothetical protein
VSINVGGGSKRDKVNVNLPQQAPGSGNAELDALNLEIARLSADEYKKAAADRAAYDASPLSATHKAIEEKAAANLLARLTGQAPVLSPEEQARVDTVFGTTQARGEEDLMRFARDLADARGMSTADSPIHDVSLQERRKFGEGMASSKAAAELDLGNTNAIFNQGLMEFQERLRQQAYMNRLALSQIQPGSQAFGNQLFGQRLGAAKRTGHSNWSTWGAGLSGSDAGGMMQGLGALGVGG